MVSNWFTGEALCFDCREKIRNILEKAIFQRLALHRVSSLGDCCSDGQKIFCHQLRAIT